MSGVSKRCDGTSGELTLVSKRSEAGGEGWPYRSLWAGQWASPLLGFYTPKSVGATFPLVQPTALEKPSSTYSPNEKRQIQRREKMRNGTKGRFSFVQSETILG